MPIAPIVRPAPATVAAAIAVAVCKPLVPCAAIALCAATAQARGDGSAAGPFPVSQRTVTVTRTTGSSFSAQIRYPATASTACCASPSILRASARAAI